MTQLLSTGGVPGLQDGEREELWDCSGGGVLNGEFEGGGSSIFLSLNDEFEGEKIIFYRVLFKLYKIFLLNGSLKGKKSNIFGQWWVW